MNERPILFSGAMVRAILAGKKTQTRRVVKPQPVEDPPGYLIYTDRRGLESGTFVKDAGWWLNCPYGDIGDRLWVRETLRCAQDGTWYYAADKAALFVREQDAARAAAWAHHKEGDVCTSIHMHRWASRLTLEIVSVRVERVQDISEADAWAEGVAPAPGGLWSARQSFAALWDSINAKHGYGWEADPWVWAIEFRRGQP